MCLESVPGMRLPCWAWVQWDATTLLPQGERDPDYALKVPDGRRRPMVERAFEHYRLNKARD